MLKIKEKDGEILTLQQSDTRYARIDRIVARLSIEDRKIDLAVLTGTPATNPVAQALTRNSNIYEIALANVLVGKNVSVITQANITDTRLNNSVCGMVAAVIDQLDTSTLFNQYETWFNEKMNEADSDYQQWFDDSEQSFTEWFNRIKNLLTEDVAGHLQNQLDELSEKIDTNTVTGVKGNAETSYRTGKVNLTPASIGASPAGHTHNYLPKSGGTLEGGLNARHISPVENNTYDLGSSGALWKRGFLLELLSTNFHLYNSGSAAVMAVGDYFTVRSMFDLNTYKPITAGAFTQASSKRYKKNVREMTEEEANKIDELEAKIFDYKNESNGVNQAGLIAEDVYKIFPNVVTLAEVNGKMVPDSIDYSKLVTPLLKKVQMLEKRVTELESK